MFAEQEILSKLNPSSAKSSISYSATTENNRSYTICVALQTNNDATSTSNTQVSKDNYGSLITPAHPPHFRIIINMELRSHKIFFTI